MREKFKRFPLVQFLLAGSCLAVLSGCVQIHRTIELNKDGSGTLTETIRFEDQLLAMAKSSPKFKALTDCLKREHLEERMASFGDVKLVKYETRESEGVIREATAVFAFDDLNKVTVPAFPHRGLNWTKQKIHFRISPPIPKTLHYYPTGALVHLMPLEISYSPAAQEPAIKTNPKTPLEKETLRLLLPIVRSMLQGFHVSLKIRAFGAIAVHSKTHTIFDVRAQDVDDDDTLMKILEWNQFPDEHFTWNEKLGRGEGLVMNKNRSLLIHVEALPPQLDPINPLKKKKR